LQAHGGSGTVTALAERFDLHVGYAETRAFATTPLLVITWGVSGSGKSWVGERLVTRLPAIRLRSDVERKRLQGLDPTARVSTAAGEGLYSPAASEATYRRLEESAAALLAARVTVIVDATFLDGVERERFRALAERLGARFRILACVAPDSILVARVRARQRANTDPSDADERVLRAQLAGSAGPPAGSDVVTLDTSQEPVWDRLLERLEGDSQST
jgi:predicted kinase